jgi:ABC-type lipoprotein export system ATPase subunit
MNSTHRRSPDHGRIRCEGLVRIYQTSEIEVHALQGLDLEVEPGELLTVVGASGSGKSTLLNILGGLDQPTAGIVQVGGHDLMRMNAAQRTSYRRSMVGFVWQQTAKNLQSYLDARRNVEFPMAIAGLSRRARRARAERLLELVGLADRLDHLPSELSGGEQQRVAIAVAVANEPRILLADEPTGELDTTTANEVFDVLRSMSVELGITGVLVTHDPLVSQQVSRTVTMRDGRISSETVREGAGRDASRVVEREFAVLDAAGRVQLPRTHVDSLDLQRRVRLELQDDHVGLWPGPGEDPS